MKTMMPKLHSTNFEGMELIRPLYYVKEQFIINWAKNAELNFLNCACKFTEKSAIENNSKRKEIKELINYFRKINPYIETNIFKSSKNVNVDALIELKKADGTRINFLDRYDK
jgi:tRNA(Ile)-lysidine synthase TilS/MesJ